VVVLVEHRLEEHRIEERRLALGSRAFALGSQPVVAEHRLGQERTPVEVELVGTGVVGQTAVVVGQTIALVVVVGTVAGHIAAVGQVVEWVAER